MQSIASGSQFNGRERTQVSNSHLGRVDHERITRTLEAVRQHGQRAEVADVHIDGCVQLGVLTLVEAGCVASERAERLLLSRPDQDRVRFATSGEALLQNVLQQSLGESTLSAINRGGRASARVGRRSRVARAGGLVVHQIATQSARLTGRRTDHVVLGQAKLHVALEFQSHHRQLVSQFVFAASRVHRLLGVRHNDLLGADLRAIAQTDSRGHRLTCQVVTFSLRVISGAGEILRLPTLTVTSEWIRFLMTISGGVCITANPLQLSL